MKKLLTALVLAVIVVAAVATVVDLDTLMVVAKTFKEFVAAQWKNFRDIIVEFVKQNRQWAAPIVFLLMFLESLAIVSLIVPAVFILIPVVSVLAGANVDDGLVLEVVLAGGTGGTLGYAISYWVGRAFGPEIEQMWPFYYFPRMFELGRTFFRKYEKSAAAAVFFGHFAGPVRGVIPLLAGMLGMGQLLFQVVNITSSFIQAALLLAGPIYGFRGLEWLINLLH
jgi:membrane protein DedA with SNARE-associated domain